MVVVISFYVDCVTIETAQSSEGTADSHDAVVAVPLDFDEMQREAVR